MYGFKDELAATLAEIDEAGLTKPGLLYHFSNRDVLLAAQPTKEFVTPEQVAALALFLCRDEASAITGANYTMDGGWTAN